MTLHTLVVGSGDCAARVTKMLAARGAVVLVAGAEKDLGKDLMDQGGGSGTTGVELLASTRLFSCSGSVGNFEVLLETNRKRVRHNVDSIIIAENCRRRDNFDRYGLRPTTRVCSLSDFTKRIEDSRDQPAAAFENNSVLFLDGLFEDGTPFILEEILHNALKIQALPHAHTAVLTGNLKVAGDGLEALYRRARQSGTLFFHFTDTLPVIRQGGDTGATATIADETTGHTYFLTPDITVVDERCMPSEYEKHLGTLLNLHTDHLGFLQTENVHRYTVFTNRAGILVCGSARGPMGVGNIAADAAEAAIAVFGNRHVKGAVAYPTARIDSGRCIKCLTCYRLCPHRSIQQGATMVVGPDACEGCGICAAECPRGAIGLGEGTVWGQLPIRSEELAGALVAFCCSRSAARAKELADCNRWVLPRHCKIVEVPCAGALSSRHILDVLAGGAGGVLVLTCHEGNCYSQTGNSHARRRVALLSEQLKPLGAIADRIEIQALAANMAAEFMQVVQRFSEKIQTMKKQRSIQ